MCINVTVITYFFFNDTATTEIYTLSLHDALPICLNCLLVWVHSILQVDPLRSGVDSYRRNQPWNDSPRQMSRRVIEDEDYTLTPVEDLADRLKRERRTELARQQAGNIFFIALHDVIVRI